MIFTRLLLNKRGRGGAWERRIMHFESSSLRRIKCIRHLEEGTDCFCSCGGYFPCRSTERGNDHKKLLAHPIAPSPLPSLSFSVSGSHERRRERETLDEVLSPHRTEWLVWMDDVIRKRQRQKVLFIQSVFIVSLCRFLDTRRGTLRKNIS